MKKLWVLAVLGMICACASAGKSDTTDLDAAIQSASMDINGSLALGTKVALLNFSSSSDALSDYVLEEMSIALVRGKKLIVVDRKEIDLIREEENFQMSGEVSDESAQEIGQKLGAQSIVSGSLVSIGESYRFRVKVINVKTAAIETSSSISVKSDPQIRYLLAQGKGLPQQAAGQSGTPIAPAQTASDVPAQPAAPAVPVSPAYKIGDTGPAGGLIFYDKGNNSGGWRYLEAAPVEAEFQAVWSEGSFKIDGDYGETQYGIGNGMRNTLIIVDKFRQRTGNWNTAAQRAYDLTFNGYDDWFLPSRDELDQMYGNLKRKKIGNFKDNIYWSSSEYRTYDACGQDFENGRMYEPSKDQKRYVRPIRQVSGPSPARSLVDFNGSNSRAKATPNRDTSVIYNIIYTISGILITGAIVLAIWGAVNPAEATL